MLFEFVFMHFLNFSITLLGSTSIVGHVLQAKPFMIVFEALEMGNLRDYLRQAYHGMSHSVYIWFQSLIADAQRSRLTNGGRR